MKKTYDKNNVNKIIGFYCAYRKVDKQVCYVIENQ